MPPPQGFCSETSRLCAAPGPRLQILGLDNATCVKTKVTNAKIQTTSQSSSRAQQNCGTSHSQFVETTWRDPNLSACYAGTERVFTDADLLINEVIRKVVSPTSHRTNEHRDVMRFWKRRQVSRQPYGLGVPR